MFSEACVSHSIHNRPHGYWFTAHPCYGAVGTRPTGMLSCSWCGEINVEMKFPGIPSTKPEGGTILAVISEKINSHVSSVLIFLCNFDCKIQVGLLSRLELLFGESALWNSTIRRTVMLIVLAAASRCIQSGNSGLRKLEGGKICIQDKDFSAKVSWTINWINILNNPL